MYALNIIFNIIITDFTLIFIGVLMGMLWECVGFWLVYKILRKYCGGYHFSTSLKCYFSSCVICYAVLLAIQYIPYSAGVWSIASAAAATLLLILTPVEAVNKPLDEKECLVFGKIANVLICAMAAIYVGAVVLSLFTAAKIISLGMIFVALFVIAGKLNLAYLKRNV